MELIDAVIENVKTAAGLLEMRIYDNLVNDLRKLLHRANPDNPAEVMKKVDILQVITGYAHLPPPGRIDLLAALIHGRYGDKKVHLHVDEDSGAVMIQFQMTPSHCAAFYQVTFSGVLPMTVNCRSWKDSDRIENHEDDCPFRVSTEYEDDCCCNMSNQNHTFTVTADEWYSTDSHDGIARLIENILDGNFVKT